MGVVNCTRISRACARRRVLSRAICQFPEQMSQVASTIEAYAGEVSMQQVSKSLRLASLLGNLDERKGTSRSSLVGRCAIIGERILEVRWSCPALLSVQPETSVDL